MKVNKNYYYEVILKKLFLDSKEESQKAIARYDTEGFLEAQHRMYTYLDSYIRYWERQKEMKGGCI